MGSTDTSSAPADIAALLRGRYRFVERVGRGGQGDVYRAIDTVHDRTVAVKVRRIPAGVPIEPVIAEGKSLFSMTPHANLAVVREDLIDDDRYLLVMDWVDGPTLAEQLHAGGPVSYLDAVEILTALASGLDHLHGQDPPIVHGDVTPSNVILSPTRGPVLVDFGLVGAGLSLGTPKYTAPEVVYGSIGSASDVYGLAATAHSLLEGSPPLEGDAPDLLGVPDEHRAKALDALRSGLSYDPSRRPASAGELVELLSPGLPEGVLTYVFTDIEGSTRRATELEDAWVDVLLTHHLILREAITSHGGHEIGTAGDSFFVVFRSAADAVSAAVAMQRGIAAHDWSPHPPLRVRMGIHTGHSILRGHGYFGLHVHTAARVEAAAAGGQILLSQAAVAAAGDLSLIGVDTLDVGSHRLKDLPSELQLFQVIADGLERDFPPLRTLAALRNNIPVPPSTFVGRSEALAKLHRLTDDDRLVSLVGPGGAGKTRLALKLAAERLHLYTDGVWFVELDTAQDEIGVVGAVAAVLSVREDQGGLLMDKLIAHVRELDILIVLDNCEHVIDVAARVAEQLLRSGPRVRIVTTSRESLAIGGERVWHVPPLSLDDERPRESEAVRLLVDRIAYAVPEFELADELVPIAAAVTRRLDGLPLAIELAAASAAVMPLPEIARQLDDRFTHLTRGSRTALDRQRTLWGAIDWSYGLLDDERPAPLQDARCVPGRIRRGVSGGGLRLGNERRRYPRSEVARHGHRVGSVSDARLDPRLREGASTRRRRGFERVRATMRGGSLRAYSSPTPSDGGRERRPTSKPFTTTSRSRWSGGPATTGRWRSISCIHS